MSIKDFTKNDQDDDNELIYATSIRRSISSGIDMIIVLALRSALLLAMSVLYLNKIWGNFYQEFYNKFGTQTVKRTPEHIEFLIQHQVFSITLLSFALILLLGACYHAYFNASHWQATVGKRIAGIIMIKEPTQAKVSFNLAFGHYFLSVVPFVFVAYLLNYQLKNNLAFYDAITANNLNLFFGFIFIFWVQTHLFTRKKTTAYDLLCKTVLINGKTKSKLPWHSA